MEGAQGQGSEVAHLLAQIRLEYEAALRGIDGLAYGISKHEFITAKMENMGKLHGELQTLVGDNAMELVVLQLSDLPDTSISLVQ